MSTLTDVANVLKHLPGQHAQLAHAGGKPGGKPSRKERELTLSARAEIKRWEDKLDEAEGALGKIERKLEKKPYLKQSEPIRRQLEGLRKLVDEYKQTLAKTKLGYGAD